MRRRICMLGVALVLAAAPALSQSPLPERFAMRARATGNNRPVRVEITIERWSDAAENDRLFRSTTAGGAQALKALLPELPVVGSMRVEAVRSYPLQFAREFVAADGSRRILLATHVPIGFQGGEGYFRASAAAFTVMEMELDAGGEGDGTAEVGTEVSLDAQQRAFGLSGSTAGSVRLSSVRRLSPE